VAHCAQGITPRASDSLIEPQNDRYTWAIAGVGWETAPPAPNFQRKNNRLFGAGRYRIVEERR